MNTRTSSAPGRRAVLRWAWRLFRREWRQQLLVLSLVTVAVAAAVSGAAVAVNAASHKGGAFGDAGALIRIDNTDPSTARSGVEVARRQFGHVEVIGHSTEAVPGSAKPLDLRAQDPRGTYGRSMLALRDGRYPLRDGEVALTADAAALLSAGIGDRVRLGGTTRIVVGRVENPGNLDDTFALVAPTATSGADSLVLLVAADFSDGRAEVPTPLPGQTQFEILGHGNNQNAVAAGVLIVTTLAMALVCLIAAAGFVVVAQRRQRQLGLLAAIGATDRHLRLVMIANGVIVGACAALVGGALGVLAWIAALPAVEDAAALRIDRFDLPWNLIVECMLLAVVASTAAAWWPARITARLPVMTALSGRPTRPRSVHRSLLLAVAFIAIGIFAITAAQPNGDRVQPALMVGGILAVVVGIVLAAPGMIRALALPARHLPFAPRLALRDLVRYQTRAAAALTAITLALGVSVTVVVISKANTPSSDEGNLSDRQLVVSVGDPRTAPSPTLGAGERAQLDALASKVADAVGGAKPLTLNVAINPTTAGDPTIREPVGAVTPVDHGFRFVSQAFVATPQLLRRYGIDPSSIRSDTDLLTSHQGNVVLLDSSVRETPSQSKTRCNGWTSRASRPRRRRWSPGARSNATDG